MYDYFMNKRNRILISCLLVVAMIVNLIPTDTVNAASEKAMMEDVLNGLTKFKDTKGHWAEKEITDLSNQGIVNGFQDGTFRPDSVITRVEFVSLVNKLFRFSATGSVNFTDVQAKDWFASQVGIAAQAGYIQGDTEGAFHPKQPLNRSETAVILSRLVPFVTKSDTDPLSGFGDRSSVPSYSRDAFGGAIDSGYMTGFKDGTLRPNKTLTRAEAAVLLDRVLKQTVGPGAGGSLKVAPKLLASAGTYGPANGTTTVHGDVTINAPGITLRNLVILGDLIIGKPVGEGDANLDKVKVAGNTLVQGGGQHSIHIDNSELGNIVIDKAGGRVRVVVGGTTVIEQMDIQSDATVESGGSNGIDGITISSTGEVTLSGNFKNVELKSNVKLTVSSGTIDHVSVNQSVTDATIKLDSGVRVAQMEVHGGTSVEGQGTIDKALVTSADVKFEKKPASVETSGAGTIPTGTSGSSGPGQGSGSGPGNTTPPVTTIRAPGVPTSVNALSGDGTATVSFAAPADNGGSAITSYTVTSTPGGKTQTGTGSPLTVTGLTNGTAYTFKVTATNSAGTSAASASSNSVTPELLAVVPDAPSAVGAVAGSGEATITFSPPIHDGGSAITEYKVTSEPGGFTQTGNGSPITVVGLNNGTEYSFTVTATNRVGTSLPSESSAAVTPMPIAGAPDAPTITEVTFGNGQATVTYSPPSNDGESEITGYTATSTPGGFTVSGTGPLTVTGLTNGTAYTFTVTARNAVGSSPPSAPSASVTPISVPGAPTIVSAVGGDGQAIIHFQPPADNGGSAITAYTVTSTDGNFIAGGTSSPITVTGLTNGTAYAFRVTATNGAGTSAQSAATNNVIPAVPDIVVTATIGSVAKYGFTIHLDQAIEGLDSLSFILRDSAGENVPIDMVTSGADATYNVWTQLSEGATYALSLAEAGYAFDEEVGVTVPVIDKTDNPVTVAGATHNGFVLTFANPVDHLFARDIVLKDGQGNRVVIPSLTETVAGLTYAVKASLTGNQTYTFGIVLSDGMLASGSIAMTDVISVASQIHSIGTSGISLKLNIPLNDLVAADFVLKDDEGSTLAIDSVTTADQGANYRIAATLNNQRTYTLSVIYSGYAFGSIPSFKVPIVRSVSFGIWGGDGIYAGFSPNIAGLDASNFSVTNASGQAIAFDVSWYAGQQFYLLNFERKGNNIYTIRAIVPGYDFGQPYVVNANGSRFDYITNASSAGFRLTLSPSMDIAESDFALKDSGGRPVSITSVTKNNKGQSYDFSANLSAGAYTLSLISDPSVSFPTVWAPIVTGLSVDDVTKSSFTIHLSTPIDGLGRNDFTLKDASDNYYNLDSVSSSDGGQSYQAVMGSELAAGTYTLAASGTLPGGATYNSGAGIPLVVPELVDARDAVISTITSNGFTVSFKNAVPGLKAANFSLVDQAGNPVPNATLGTSDGGLTYQVAATLTKGKSYKVIFNKIFYAFDAFSTVYVNKDATARVSRVTTNGFALYLTPALPGLDVSKVIIKNDQGQALNEALTTSDGGASYQIDFGNLDYLGWGKTYSVEVNETGYTTPAIYVTTPVVPSVTSKSATQLVINFNASVPGLTKANFKLVDDAGAIVAISSAVSTDDGMNYTVKATMPAGKNYWITYLPIASYQLYAPLKVAVVKNVTAAATNASLNGFTLTFSEAVAGLREADLTLKNSSNVRLPANQYTISTTDGGLTYRVVYKLSFADTYTVDLSSDAYGTYQDKYALAAPVSFVIPIPGTVRLISINNETIMLSVSQDLDFAAGNFTLKNEAGEDVPFTLEHPSPNIFVLVSSVSIPTAYTLKLSYPGYDFGPAITISRDIHVETFLYNQTQKGFGIGFTPAIPGLEAGDFAIVDAEGHSVGVTSVSTTDFGKNYRVEAPLTGGTTYTVTVTKTNYNPDAATLSLDANGAAIDNLSKQGFRLNLLKKHDFGSVSIQVFDSSGKPVTIQAVTSPNQGLSYDVEVALVPGEVYTVRTENIGLNNASPGNDYGADLTIRVIPVAASYGGMVPNTGNEIVVQFDPAMPSLDERNFRLTAGGQDVPIWDAETADSGATYVLTATFTQGNHYGLLVSKDGYDFGAKMTLNVPFGVIQTVFNIGAKEVGIALNPAVPGLTAANFVLTDSLGNVLAASAVSTSDDGAAYTVSANFTGGQTYTVTAIKDGYDFGALASAFIPSELAAAVVASSSNGVTLSFNPAVAGLTARNFALTHNGQPIPIDSVATSDGGASYTLVAALAEGQDYSVAVALAGYVFVPTQSAFHVDIPVNPALSDFASAGFVLKFDHAVAGLTAQDLALRDSQYRPIAIGSLATTDGGLTYIVRAALTQSQLYSLGLSKNGYRFGAGSSFIVPIPVAKSADAISDQGFTVHLATPVADLTSSNVNLLDGNGAHIAIASVVSTDGGSTYRVTAALRSGEAYTLQLAKTGYDFGASATLNVQATISYSISNIQNATFAFTLSSPVPHLNGGYVKLTDDSGHSYTFERSNDLYDTSGASFQGYSFDVKFPIVTGASYTLQIVDPGHPFGPAIEVVKPFVVAPSVTKPVQNGFDLSLGTSSVDLTPANVSLFTASGAPVTGITLINGDVPGTYKVIGNIAEGYGYTLKLSKQGYDFGADIAFFVPIKINASVSNADTNGFTVSFDRAVENVGIALKLNGQTVNIQSATTVDGGYTYQVIADLGANTVHQLILTKEGYDFGTQLNVSNEATAPALLNAVTNETGNQIVLNFDKPLSTLPTAASFSVKYNGSWLGGISRVLGTDKTQIIIQLDPYTLINPSDKVFVSFAGKNTVKAANGTYLAAFNDAVVLIGTTAIGYAMTQAKYDGLAPARKLRDDYKLSALDAANIMRVAGFQTTNYGRSIASVYGLSSRQLAQLFRDMQVDGLTALAGLKSASFIVITESMVQDLVAVGYDAAIFVPDLRAANYQSDGIALILLHAGLSVQEITVILSKNLMDPPSKTVLTLRSIRVGLADTINRLASVYGLSQVDVYRALRTANIGIADAVAALVQLQGDNPKAVDAIKVLYAAGYTPQEIGSVIASKYGLGDAKSFVTALLTAGLNEDMTYVAAGKAFAHREVTVAMLNAGILFGSVLGAVKASGDSDGAVAIAYAFKLTDLGVDELVVALKTNGYSIEETADAVISVGYGVKDLAILAKMGYGLDTVSAYRLLADRFRGAFVSASGAGTAQPTIFQAMIGAGYDSVELARYYLDHVRSRNLFLVLREMQTAGIGLDQALRTLHDIALADGYPLTLDTAFSMFYAATGYYAYTSDEVLSAVLFAFAGDSSVTLDVQTVGLAFYKVRLYTWSTGFMERAKQLRNRMGMTMQQWMELEKSDGRVAGPGVPSTWGIIRDTLAIYSSSTVNIQDVVNAMSTSSQFTLGELIQGIDDYFGGSANVKGIIGLLKNTGIPMQTILTAIETNPRYGNNWIDRFRQFGLTASDVVVYCQSKGLTTPQIVEKLSPYSLNEIVLALRSDLGLNSGEVLDLLKGSNVAAVSQAIGYVYREAERDVAVKLLKIQGYNASEIVTYLNNHGVVNLLSIISYLMTAGFTKSEVTKVVLDRNSGVTQLPDAIAALRSVYGQQSLGVSEVLEGASITTAEQALEFLATHHYDLLQMATALKTVYGKTAGEATALLNKRFAGIYTLSDILSKVSLGYSATEESTILDVLAAKNVASPKAAIVTMRQLGYDKIAYRVNLTIIVNVLKNGYGQDAAQTTALLFEDAAYSALDVSYAINAVYRATDEIGITSKLLVGAGVTDARGAVRYLVAQNANINLIARVLNEIYHEYIVTAIDYITDSTSYSKTFIFQAVQSAYGTDPLFGYLSKMKLNGASAYQISNELDSQGRISGTVGQNFLVDTLLSLGYDKESIMYEVLMRFKRYQTEAEIGQEFVKAGYSDPMAMAKLLLRTQYNPNDGYSPANILTSALPNAPRGSIAQGIKNAGFTSEAAISGMLGTGFDDSVAALLKDFGFSATRAAEILHSARYSTEGQVGWLKKLGYPLKDFFGELGSKDASLVAILKGKGYSAIEIAQGLYRSNVDAYWMIKYLDEGGFTDLPTLVKAYYQSGEPMMWVIHDIYGYGTKGQAHRWQLLDVVRELMSNESISMTSLYGLVNYANGNNINETFRIIRTLSTAEQDALHASLGIADQVVGEHVANIVALTVLRSNGVSASKAAAILKSEGGVSDWKYALLILFMTGYSVMDVIDGVFDAYRTEIGIQILIAIFSSGAGQLIKDWDKYKFVIEKIVQIVSKNVR